MRSLPPLFQNTELLRDAGYFDLHRRGACDDFPVFAEKEMMDLLEYIRMNAKGRKEAAFITPGNPGEGKKVFAAKGCVKCHAVRGEGGKEAEDLGKRAKTFYKSLTQIASSMWNKGPV